MGDGVDIEGRVRVLALQRREVLLELHLGLGVQHGVEVIDRFGLVCLLDIGSQMLSAMTVMGGREDGTDGVEQAFLPVRHDDDALECETGKGDEEVLAEPAPGGGGLRLDERPSEDDDMTLAVRRGGEEEVVGIVGARVCPVQGEERPRVVEECPRRRWGDKEAQYRHVLFIVIATVPIL